MKKEFLLENGVSEAALEAVLAEHEREMDQLRFSHVLERAILRAGGRSVKAVSAMLDLEAVEGGEDREAALDAALAELKKEHGYLFREQEAVPPPYAVGTGARQVSGEQVQTLAGALRERFRRN